MSSHDSLMQCWKTAFAQKGKNLALAYFLVMGDPHGHPAVTPLSVCTRYSHLSGQTAVPVRTLPTASIG